MKRAASPITGSLQKKTRLNLANKVASDLATAFSQEVEFHHNRLTNHGRATSTTQITMTVLLTTEDHCKPQKGVDRWRKSVKVASKPRKQPITSRKSGLQDRRSVSTAAPPTFSSETQVTKILKPRISALNTTCPVPHSASGWLKAENGNSVFISLIRDQKSHPQSLEEVNKCLDDRIAQLEDEAAVPPGQCASPYAMATSHISVVPSQKFNTSSTCCSTSPVSSEALNQVNALLDVLIPKLEHQAFVEKLRESAQSTSTCSWSESSSVCSSSDAITSNVS